MCLSEEEEEEEEEMVMMMSLRRVIEHEQSRISFLYMINICMRGGWDVIAWMDGWI